MDVENHQEVLTSALADNRHVPLSQLEAAETLRRVRREGPRAEPPRAAWTRNLPGPADRADSAEDRPSGADVLSRPQIQV